MTIETVNSVAAPLIRKYDWSTEEIEDGVRLTVTDGQADASVDITTGEDIESEIKRLIKEVDAHNYVTLG